MRKKQWALGIAVAVLSAACGDSNNDGSEPPKPRATGKIGHHTAAVSEVEQGDPTAGPESIDSLVFCSQRVKDYYTIDDCDEWSQATKDSFCSSRACTTCAPSGCTDSCVHVSALCFDYGWQMRCTANCYVYF